MKECHEFVMDVVAYMENHRPWKAAPHNDDDELESDEDRRLYDKAQKLLKQLPHNSCPSGSSTLPHRPDPDPGRS